jgi:translation initiation factor IF-3
VAIAEALKKAAEAGLDLVEIAPQANPPVCRVMDYAKFLYAKEKQERENRQHQRQTQLKELRFRPQIDDHDYQTKLKSLVKFLKRGNKVKVTLVFRGREMAHQEFGRRLLDRLQVDIAEVATVERPPMQEGRFIFMTLTPK